MCTRKSPQKALYKIETWWEKESSRGFLLHLSQSNHLLRNSLHFLNWQSVRLFALRVNFPFFFFREWLYFKAAKLEVYLQSSNYIFEEVFFPDFCLTPVSDMLWIFKLSRFFCFLLGFLLAWLCLLRCQTLHIKHFGIWGFKCCNLPKKQIFFCGQLR